MNPEDYFIGYFEISAELVMTMTNEGVSELNNIFKGMFAIGMATESSLLVACNSLYFGKEGKVWDIEFQTINNNPVFQKAVERANNSTIFPHARNHRDASREIINQLEHIGISTNLLQEGAYE